MNSINPVAELAKTRLEGYGEPLPERVSMAILRRRLQRRDCHEQYHAKFARDTELPPKALPLMDLRQVACRSFRFSIN